MEQNKNINVYFISNFLMNFGRVIPHAVLTILLLSKGVSIIDIATIQSAYMLAIMLFEFPSGVLADTYSRKKYIYWLL